MIYNCQHHSYKARGQYLMKLHLIESHGYNWNTVIEIVNLYQINDK